MIAESNGKRFLTREEVCAEFRVTMRWLKRKGREMPGYRRLSHKKVVYERTALENWMRQRQWAG